VQFLRIEFEGLTTDDLVVVSFKIKRSVIEKLDKLVDKGVFPSRSEAIRYAILILISKLQKEMLNAQQSYRINSATNKLYSY